MKIKWYGHSAWGITSADGTTIITDPYEAGSYDGAVGYAPISDSADVILATHEHPDHYGVGAIPGNPEVFLGAGKYRFNQYEFEALASFHDESGGSERGPNAIFLFEVDGVKMAHLGDQGIYPPEEIMEKLKGVEVVFIPVGGHFTIDAQTAMKIIDALAPRVVFPMHYKTDVLGFPIAPLDDFVKLFGEDRVKRFDDCQLELTKETLPEKSEVWVCSYAK